MKRHGDAVLIDRADFVFRVMDDLRFPRIPAGNAGRARIVVRDLPVGILPSAFLIEVPAEEDFKYDKDQPWRDLVFSVRAVDRAGRTIYFGKFDMSRDWNGGSQPGRAGKTRKIFLRGAPWRAWLENLSREDARNYTLVIDIIRPSRRANDSIEIEAMTRVQGDPFP